MGVDLKVLTSSFRERGGELLATASLRLERDPGLLSQLAIDARPCLARPLSAGLKLGHYEDEGLRWDEVDRYGEPLTFVTPVELRRVQVPGDLSPWNQAVMAFLTALPPDTRIVLYWC